MPKETYSGAVKYLELAPLLWAEVDCQESALCLAAPKLRLLPLHLLPLTTQ